MRFIKRIGLALTLGAALISSAALAQQQQFVNILTGGQSGVYYPLGVALSQIYAKAIPNTRSTAQVTKASAENLNLLQAGRGELALALGDSVSDAWKGDAESGFKTKLDKLRGLSATYNNYIQIVANADAGIKTLADLKGKRISVGAAKSGTELNARAILKAAGLTYADLGKVEYLPFGESVELMKNRQLDATLPDWVWLRSAIWPRRSRSWWWRCRLMWSPRWVTPPTSQPSFRPTPMLVKPLTLPRPPSPTFW